MRLRNLPHLFDAASAGATIVASMLLPEGFGACSTYNRRGKKYCASNSIPETTLKDACAQVLGLSEYDAESVENRIEQIEAMPGNILIFHLNDGTRHEVSWAFPSRSESWTDEMRQKAAEQMRRRYAETGH